MNEILPIALIFFFSFIFFYILISKKLNQNKADKSLLEWLKTMQNSVDNSQSNMIKTLQENSKQLNERLDKTAEVIRDVGKGVGEMSEIGRSIKELQDVLRSPKLRGNIGEEILKDLISQMFPKNSFNLQYQFKSGEKVDAAIKTEAGILSIDSKFPMENYQKMLKAKDENEKLNFEKELIRDVKKHISAISKKYILPQEGTMDFALMYVPSEGIYYEIVNMSEVMEFAKQERVYIVSPSTLYAHLQMILLSFEGRKIESRAKDILILLRSLQIDYKKVDENIGLLGKHLNSASAQLNNVTIGFSKLGHKLNTTDILQKEDAKIINPQTESTE